MIQKKFIESKLRAFDKKILTYNNDRGFIEYVEGYDNTDFDVELIRDFIETALKEIVKEHFQEIMVEKKNWANKSDFSEAPHLDNRDEAMFDQGINQALDQITSRHNKFLS